MNTFGERLKTKIKSSGMKQNELAELMELHYSTISGWVTGKCMPTEERLKTLCELLDCDADWLLGNTRQLNRNASGAIDTTMYEAIKNIESEGNNMDCTKGTICEVETEFGARSRKAVIVSSDWRAGDKYLNAIFLTDEERGKIVVPIERGGTWYADCTKVTLITENRVLDFVGEATAQEMADIDAGIIEALGLPHEVTLKSSNDTIDDLNAKIMILELEKKNLKSHIKALEHENKNAIASTTPSENVLRLQLERDLYKEQYEKMLNRLIG